MHWLLKAEPESRIVKGQDVKYTIDDLAASEVGTWDGVRNNEARKHLLNMRKGDTAFFYRSNCKEPAIVGTMQIVREHYPDKTAKDPKAAYYDAKSPDRWVVVDVKYESHLDPVITLKEIKQNPDLSQMQLVKRSRLSVTPVTDEEWDIVMRMSREKAGSEKKGTGDDDNAGGQEDECDINHAEKKESKLAIDEKEISKKRDKSSTPAKRRRVTK